MAGMATYVLFMVHANTDDNDNTLNFYSIEDGGNGGNGGNGGTAERMAEWQNGRSGYICMVLFMVHANDDDNDTT